MQKLSKRLQAVADLVKKGSAIVDIGTDHGYIPVYLIQNNIAKSALACDINEGPLKSCINLVDTLELNDKIDTRISNGLDKVNSNECDTIIIAGMGGELICDILSRCEWIIDKRLILQPMTHPEILRKYLFDNGFDIVEDLIIPDGKHHYSLMSCEYNGHIEEKSIVDYYIGNINDFSDREYFLHLLNYLNNKIKSGEDLQQVIDAVEELI